MVHNQIFPITQPAAQNDGPSPVPEDELRAIHDNYVDTAAERIGEWFLSNYEDPAQSTPCDEGEYVYIWGKCDTRGILEEALSGVVPDEFLEEIVEATIGKLDGDDLGQSCGDVCVPKFGRYE